jgi:hypothetical protein
LLLEHFSSHGKSTGANKAQPRIFFVYKWETAVNTLHAA